MTNRAESHTARPVRAMHVNVWRGFSLIELAVVLVILGLIAGGILTGQSLIRSAQLNGITSDLSRYVSATQTFQDRYADLPGDMSNATTVWGTATNCPGTSAQPSTTAATCNGDGDRMIEDTNSNSNSNEIYRYWQQLANAGLVEGSFTGVTGPTHAHYASVSGQNVPDTKISRVGISTYYYGPAALNNAILFEGTYGNSLLVGLDETGANQGFFLTPAELWSIDKKMDDGRPGTGKIVTYETHTHCHNATASDTVAIANTAEYKLASNLTGCAMLLRGAF
jgi:prepilin-type N-terminal cleavage/methylation domain-containing protein